MNEKFVNVAVSVAMPNLRGRVAELGPRAGVGDVGGGEHRDAPRAGDAAAEPKATVFVEQTWTRVWTSTWSVLNERSSMARLALPIISARTP